MIQDQSLHQNLQILHIRNLVNRSAKIQILIQLLYFYIFQINLNFFILYFVIFFNTTYIDTQNRPSTPAYESTQSPYVTPPNLFQNHSPFFSLCFSNFKLSLFFSILFTIFNWISIYNHHLFYYVRYYCRPNQMFNNRDGTLSSRTTR